MKFLLRSIAIVLPLVLALRFLVWALSTPGLELYFGMIADWPLIVWAVLVLYYIERKAHGSNSSVPRDPGA